MNNQKVNQIKQYKQQIIKINKKIIKLEEELQNESQDVYNISILSANGHNHCGGCSTKIIRTFETEHEAKQFIKNNEKEYTNLIKQYKEEHKNHDIEKHTDFGKLTFSKGKIPLDKIIVIGIDRLNLYDNEFEYNKIHYNDLK